MTHQSSKDPVTQEYLDRALDKKLESELAIFETKIDMKIDNLKRELSDLFVDQIDNLVTRIDPLLSELEDSRLDREISTEQMQNHEKRITKIEKKLQVS